MQARTAWAGSASLGPLCPKRLEPIRRGEPTRKNVNPMPSFKFILTVIGIVFVWNIIDSKLGVSATIRGATGV